MELADWEDPEILRRLELQVAECAQHGWTLGIFKAEDIRVLLAFFKADAARAFADSGTRV